MPRASRAASGGILESPGSPSMIDLVHAVFVFLRDFDGLGSRLVAGDLAKPGTWVTSPLGSSRLVAPEDQGGARSIPGGELRPGRPFVATRERWTPRKRTPPSHRPKPARRPDAHLDGRVGLDYNRTIEHSPSEPAAAITLLLPIPAGGGQGCHPSGLAGGRHGVGSGGRSWPAPPVIEPFSCDVACRSATYVPEFLVLRIVPYPHPALRYESRPVTRSTTTCGPRSARCST